MTRKYTEKPADLPAASPNLHRKRLYLSVTFCSSIPKLANLNVIVSMKSTDKYIPRTGFSAPASVALFRSANLPIDLPRCPLLSKPSALPPSGSKRAWLASSMQAEFPSAASAHRGPGPEFLGLPLDRRKLASARGPPGAPKGPSPFPRGAKWTSLPDGKGARCFPQGAKGPSRLNEGRSIGKFAECKCTRQRLGLLIGETALPIIIKKNK